MEPCSDVTLVSNEQLEINFRNPGSSLHPFWKALPQELRLMVLEKLPPLAKERHEMARWASVSREWQYFFEPEIFENLSIRSCGREIGRMGQVVRGYRMQLVKHITLLVGTAEFTGVEYDQREDVETITAINVVVVGALTALFQVLSQWGKAIPGHHIALELCAGFKADNHDMHPCNAFHRYTRDRAQANRILDGTKRLLSTFSDPESQAQELPQVPIIERFSMDRQYYRSFSGEVLERIVSSMPCIRYFGYMYWPMIGRNNKGMDEVASLEILQAVFNSPRIQTLNLWNAQPRTFPWDLRQHRPVNYSLSSMAVEATYRCERVAMANVIDATDFFEDHINAISTGAPGTFFDQPRRWPCLTNLALTTPADRLAPNVARTNFLVLAAGLAAIHMPKLEMMEVFSPTELVAFSLRFDIGEDQTAKLSIAATWQLEICEEAFKPWQLVADCRALRLICEVETIQSKELHSKLQLFPKIVEW
ncbi:hypothetical protein CNYM01_04501 [Colletotrichum nymphaeae SA-01]|uniref:DUF6546 domain-containing protein n=1 Tax=Colletotrichum nymphaeae SA-01 TaxID=1460502 RepID=A0A135TSX3_9PEZI|nr:hypothetical protein CNYM01_04501 [Colletotrichum nymphaeae SA-01]